MDSWIGKTAKVDEEPEKSKHYEPPSDDKSKVLHGINDMAASQAEEQAKVMHMPRWLLPYAKWLAILSSILSSAKISTFGPQTFGPQFRVTWASLNQWTLFAAVALFVLSATLAIHIHIAQVSGRNIHSINPGLIVGRVLYSLYQGKVPQSLIQLPLDCTLGMTTSVCMIYLVDRIWKPKRENAHVESSGPRPADKGGDIVV